MTDDLYGAIPPIPARKVREKRNKSQIAEVMEEALLVFGDEDSEDRPVNLVDVGMAIADAVNNLAEAIRETKK